MLSCNNVFELSGLLPENGGDGSAGIVINGIDYGDTSGYSVSGAGDVNGDGYDDVVIGARGADPNGVLNAGESYVVFGGASFSASLDLSTLDGTNGFVLNGINDWDYSGISVSGAGDVNGDGYDDVIIGAHWADPNSTSYAGESYVVFGAASFAASLDLSTLDGTNGFVLNGIDYGDESGSSVSGAGDVNGDGYDDVVIGAYPADPNGTYKAGESYVVLGGASFSASLDLSTLDGTDGFVLNGIYQGDKSGYSVSGAGDVNGDGYDDVLIGAPYFGYHQPGASYVVFGAASFAASLDLSTLDGTNGFVLNGFYDPATFGYSVSGAGDVNGDGYDDVLIGAPYFGYHQPGASYVVFGAASFAASLDLSTLDGTNGFVLNGFYDPATFGYSVSGAGDVNGDGYDDVLIGAPRAANYAGESYVVFGGASFSASLDLSTLDGTNGFVLNAIDRPDGAGWSVSGAGDVNGDGYDDVLIGAFRAEPNSSQINYTGESYVVFGGASFSASLDLATLDSTNGFILNGIDAEDYSGFSVSGAGDVNGDGYDDVLIGARLADPNGTYAAGESYLFFGRPIPLDVTPPFVDGVDVGSDLQSFVVQFNDDCLHSVRAYDPGNYRIKAAGVDAVFDTPDDVTLAVSSVEYDQVTDRITVQTVDAFFDDLIRLEIDGDDATTDGTSGVTDLAGNHLAGGDFTAVIDLRALSLADNVLAKTESLGLSTGAENSLTEKLDAALHLLGVETANEQGIVAKLDAFIHGIMLWFDRGEISLADRDDLIDDAELIIFGLTMFDEAVL